MMEEEWVPTHNQATPPHSHTHAHHLVKSSILRIISYMIVFISSSFDNIMCDSFSSSEAEWLCLVHEALPLLSFGPLLEHLRIVIDGPWILLSSFLLLGHHLFHTLHLFFLHLLHHLILLAHCHRGHDGRYTLDQDENEPTDCCILEGDAKTSTDGKNTSCDETSCHCVPGVIFLSVVDQ